MNDQAQIQTEDATPVTEPLEMTPAPNGTSELTKAVCKVMEEVERLKKDGENTFDKFKYVSIDQNKDAIRPLLAKNGLEPCLTQVSMEPFTTLTKEKKELLNYLCVFDCWLKHSSGEAGDPERLYEIVPFKAAQTGSILRSYVVKIYLAGKFLQSGGDDHEDPDSGVFGKQDELSKAAARKPYERLQSEVRKISDSGTAEELKEWVERNNPLLSSLPKDWYLLMKDEHRQAEFQINYRAQSAKAAESLPADVEAWLSELDANLAGAQEPSVIAELWNEAEPIVMALPALERDRAHKMLEKNEDRFGLVE